MNVLLNISSMEMAIFSMSCLVDTDVHWLKDTGHSSSNEGKIGFSSIRLVVSNQSIDSIREPWRRVKMAASEGRQDVAPVLFSMDIHPYSSR